MLVQKVEDAVNAGALSDYDKTRAENVRAYWQLWCSSFLCTLRTNDAQMTQADAKYVIELSSELVKKLIDLFYSAKSWKPSVTLYIYKDIWNFIISSF